jgi:hypothetical protein
MTGGVLEPLNDSSPRAARSEDLRLLLSDSLPCSGVAAAAFSNLRGTANAVAIETLVLARVLPCAFTRQFLGVVALGGI